MAVETEMIRNIARVVSALDDYAKEEGWGPEDYRIFVRINELWGQIHVALVAAHYRIADETDQRISIMDAVKRQLPDIIDDVEAMDFSLMTLAQMRQGGIYTLGPEFHEAHRFIATHPVA